MKNYVITLFFFFFNDTATTEIYTLSLHDALPIPAAGGPCAWHAGLGGRCGGGGDRKSTRLNSSHANISYAVFCLKKKNTQEQDDCQYITKTIHQREPSPLTI